MAAGNPIQALPPEKKVAWNNFIDFMHQKGYAGSEALDDRNMKLGQGLMAQYNKANPASPINYNDVAAVQADLQRYRSDLVNKWKAGTAATDSIKSENDIMPGISKVDGWLGSKTSSYKFPTAVVTHSNGTQTNFGVNTDLYDKFIAAKKVSENKLREK